jgi:hypothetical protein
MRIYLMTDLEGGAGVQNALDWTRPVQYWYDLARQLLTAEVNAAVAGSFDGADEVLVADGHGPSAVNAPGLDPNPAGVSSRGPPWRPQACGQRRTRRQAVRQRAPEGRGRISKRDSRYLRTAVMQASEIAVFKSHDPLFTQVYQVYQRHIDRGKHHLVALSHVANKMLHVVFSVLKNNRPCTPILN